MGLTQSTPPVCEPITLNEAKLHVKQDSTADDTGLTRIIATAREYVEGVRGEQLVCATWQETWDSFPSKFVLSRHPLVSITSITYVDTAGDTQTVTSTDYTAFTNRAMGEVELAYSKSWPSTRSIADAVTVTYVAGHAAQFTANATTDKCTFSGRTFVDDDIVRLSNSGGASAALPTGLSTLAVYYVIEQALLTCELSATEGGAKIDITATGTGTHFMGVVPEHLRAAMLACIADLYEHRESQSEVRLQDNQFVQRLLDLHRLRHF